MPRAFRESESKITHRKAMCRWALLLGTTALVALPGAAAAKDWTGANSNLWTDNLNWNPTGEPTAADQVVISVPGNVLIVGGVTAVASQLDLSPGGAGGSVQIDNGSALTLGGPAVLGRTVGTNGTLMVGNGSLMFVDNGNLDVGDTGTGSLYVVNGGFLSVGATTGNLVVGRSATGLGRIVIDGSGSRIVSGGVTAIGGDGDGRLRITNGGVMEGVDVSIGNSIGGAGTAIVSGPGSRWDNTGNVFVGTSGTGNLTIADGGVVTGNTGTLGLNSFGNGVATVDGAGSLWDTTNDLTVGSVGTGMLTIANGGTVRSGRGHIATSLLGSGAVTVDGAGSSWITMGDMFVGGAGPGTLTVVNGGSVLTGGIGILGAVAGAVGTASVDGAGSTWQLNGTLSVGDDGLGSLTISNGGSVTNTDASVGTSSIAGGSVSVAGPGSSWTNSGTLTVGNLGAGTMTVSNGGFVSSAYGIVGLGAASGGRVMVDGTGSNWTVANSLYVGADGNGALTISNGGTVNVGSYLGIAAGAGSVGALNIGAAPGDPAAAAGSITTGNILPAGQFIIFGAGDGTINFNHTDTAYDFSNRITGAGTINQYAGTTILSGNSSTFTGLTVVHGGTLAVNGSLGGTLDVMAGGRLQGIGTVGDIIVAGTIAPGNSIGTLNVAGPITFNPGSIYEVEVNAAGQSDKIIASGTATIIGGSVKVLAGMGNYAPATTYTILTANGGRSGTFTEGVTSNLAFLYPSLSYDANNVYLTMTRNNTDFAAIGLTPNQIAAGGGVDSLGFGNPVYNAVLNLSADQARHAFDQLSGEIHASARTALIEDSRFIRNAVNDRIRAAFDSVGAARVPVMAYADGGPQLAPATTDRFAVWGQAFGSWGHTDGDGNAARLNRSIGGFFIGGDAPVFDIWRFGAVAGYSRATFDVKDRRSSGASDNYHVGLYGGTQWGDLAFRTGAAYTLHDVTTSRSVAFPGFADSLKGDYNAATAQVFGEFGYGIRAGNIAFEPFANLAYVNLRTDGFTENGGAAALTGSDATTDATFTTLGLRASGGFTMGSVNANARGMLGWRHAFGDVAPLSTVAFAGGSAFTIAGVPIAHNAAVVEAGLDFAIVPTATLGISYGGQFGSGISDQSIKANFNVKF